MAVKFLSVTAAAALACGAWKCVPRSGACANRRPAQPAWLVFEVPPVTDTATQLQQALAVFESDPTEQGIAVVHESLKQAERALAHLALRVAQTSGGARAEAEIERIELQRLRDATMARLAIRSMQMHTARGKASAETLL